jgi:hypothetical protein
VLHSMQPVECRQFLRCPGPAISYRSWSCSCSVVHRSMCWPACRTQCTVHTVFDSNMFRIKYKLYTTKRHNKGTRKKSCNPLVHCLLSCRWTNLRTGCTPPSRAQQCLLHASATSSGCTQHPAPQHRRATASAHPVCRPAFASPAARRHATSCGMMLPKVMMARSQALPSLCLEKTAATATRAAAPLHAQALLRRTQR